MRLAITSLAAAAVICAFGTAGASASSLSLAYGFCAKKNCVDGRNSDSPVSRDASGNLYGVTRFQTLGNSQRGILYKLTANGDGTYAYKTLYKLCDMFNKRCNKGSIPNGRLAVSPAGDVFGTTYRGDGGKADGGVVYEFTGDGKYNALFKLCPNCTTPLRPVAGVTWAGAQFGTSWDGIAPLYLVARNDVSGIPGARIYQIAKPKHKNKFKLAEILASDGPIAALTVDLSGNLFYDVTDDFHGGIFKLSFNGSNWVNTQVWTLCAAHTDCNEGKDPRALVVDKTGNLYATSATGGDNKNGTVFRLAAPNYTSMSVLHSFCIDKPCSDGVTTPFAAPLAIDQTGNVYGATSDGGGNDFQTDKSGAGVIYRVGTDGSYTKLYSFCAVADCTDGADPLGGVTIDDAGSLYGTAFEGGPQIGSGEVFRFTP